MGKGNRVRVERADERKAKKEAAAKKAASEKLFRILTTVVALVLVIAIVVTVAYSAFFKDMIGSKRMHDSIAVSNENYELSSAQLSYLFYSTYNSYLNQYGSYISYLGLDTSSPLDEQDCTMTTEEGDTWFDYFVDSAKSSAEQYMVLYSEALARGLSLDDSEKEDIDHAIEDLKAAAEENSMSFKAFLRNAYGDYVTEADVRATLELQQLANKAYNDIYDDPTYSDEALTTENEENLSTYYFTDYKSIQIKAEYEEDAEDDVIEQANADAKAAADKILAAATSEEAFDKAVEEYYTSTHEIVADDAEESEEISEETAEEETANTMTETELADAVAATLTEGAAYSVSDDFGKWAFEQDDDKNYLRKAGDTSLITDEENETYTVYYMVKPMYRHDYATKNARHLLITVDTYDADHGLADADAKAKAEELLAEFKAGEATEDAFAALATANTMDEGSKVDGGLYENVNKGDMVEEFENWIFDANRKAGDTEIISTDYGYHIMYFVGDGRTAWMVEAEATLRSEDYHAAYEDLSEKYAVTYDDDAVALVK